LIKRPSKREIYNRIELAKKIVKEATTENHKIIPIDPDVLALDAIELGYQVINLKMILEQLLNEVRIPHYAGGYPPQKTYKKPILNLELFPFKWKSARFGCMTYLKFCLGDSIFFLVSLHKDRP